MLYAEEAAMCSKEKKQTWQSSCYRVGGGPQSSLGAYRFE